MRLMITGAAGMLGQDVCASAAAAGHEAMACGHGSLDITDAAAVKRVVGQRRPDAVINCAAYTDVDGAESASAQAQLVNGQGAGNVAAAAGAAGAWTVHVSSDYVFDGRSRQPYVESDPVGPQSEYGRSKLAGELAVAAACPEAHTIVRTAWLFGRGGSCFPSTITRLATQRDVLSVVADQVGCPTFTAHLAPTLVALAGARNAPGVVHAVGAEHCSWFEFATEIVAQAGLRCEVRPASTEAMARPAPRPAWSVLGSERGPLAPRLPHWRQGLKEYMGLAVSTT